MGAILCPAAISDIKRRAREKRKKNKFSRLVMLNTSETNLQHGKKEENFIDGAHSNAHINLNVHTFDIWFDV